MEWISVRDSHPCKNQKVMVKTSPKGIERIATYFPKEFEDRFMEELGFSWVFEDNIKGEDFCKITHWMPLQESPKTLK